MLINLFVLSLSVAAAEPVKSTSQSVVNKTAVASMPAAARTQLALPTGSIPNTPENRKIYGEEFFEASEALYPNAIQTIKLAARTAKDPKIKAFLEDPKNLPLLRQNIMKTWVENNTLSANELVWLIRIYRNGIFKKLMDSEALFWDPKKLVPQIEKVADSNLK